MEVNFHEIWKDPVWSKVIGGLIVALIIFIVSTFRKKIFRRKTSFPSDEEMIMESLKTRQFPKGRTTSGIITDTGLSRDTINKVLNQLEDQGIVENKKGKRNIWSLTIKGRKEK